jgi:hypothetical protein
MDPKKTATLIVEVRQRVDDIQTEATRLAVFAATITDSDLAGRLKMIATAVFRSATEIELRLAKMKRNC